MMKKLALLLLAIFVFFYAARAQQNVNSKNDTIRTALMRRMVNHTLSKADSAMLILHLTKIHKIDTVRSVINGKGLDEKNMRMDSIELKLASCDFENEVNAMILYDLGTMSGSSTGISVQRHKRIKIFNEKGVGAANIRLDYTNQFGAEQIDEIAGRTINLINGKVEYTELDPKLVYHEDKDKYHQAIIFSMPNVKAGSIIEISYAWQRTAPRALPGWDFQSDLPTSYSQFAMQLYPDARFSLLDRTTFHMAKDSTIFGGAGHVWAMSNVPSLKNEPFIRAPDDGVQSLKFLLSSVTSPLGGTVDLAGSWATVGRWVVEDKEWDKAFNQNINDKEGLVKQAKKFPDVDAKVSFLFNQVKTLMKWNGEKNWTSKDGIKKAWQDKSGNWAEINMVLCRLLNQAGVKAYPMLASTRDNGKMFRNFPDIQQANKLVAYVEVSPSQYYVLDASGKYNNYNEVPFDLLNSYGLYLNKDQGIYDMVFLKNDNPVKQEVRIVADIKPDGTMVGTAQVNSFSYNKTNALQLYNQLDEQKYMQGLSDNDNNLKILSLKLQNAAVDSLPLTQEISFTLSLPGTDDNYIYFNPNLFTGLHTNPFINERRFTDIDLGCNYLFSINGRYKIPGGYKIESLPKNQVIAIPGDDISFRRTVFEQDGYIIVNYVISYKKSFFFPKDIYYKVYDYFKKMNELLNEQVVFKKS